MSSSTPRNPVVYFLVLVTVCVAGLFSYLNWVKSRTAGSMISKAQPVEGLIGEPPKQTAPPDAIDDVTKVDAARAGTSKPTAREHREAIFFRNAAAGSGFGKLAVADGPDFRSRKFVGDLSCEVFHIAAGVGLCLTADQSVLRKYGADVLDATFTRRFHFDLPGVPSRCRVSPDGRFAAWTVFLSGHSYASAEFSTQTVLIDTTTGEMLGDLEGFAASLDGHPFKSTDFNFWGVTFAADSNTFYCTLSSNRKHYLARGDIKSRSFSVIREGVECPSLSPDGTRIAYKSRNTVSGRPAFIPPPQVTWQLHVLELATMNDIALVEIRSVDDQLAWLDDSHVLYALPGQTDSNASTDVWMAPVDGSTPPKRFLPAAYSPAVVR